MARPIETGLGYFPMNTGIFSDRKIRKLLKTFDAKGYLIYSFVLCEIYKDKGYFVRCDSDFLFDISDTLNQTESLVKEVIQFCVINGLFDKRVFDVENVLTSIGVQKRYIKIKNWPISKLDKKYIISLECGVIEEKQVINQEKQGVIQEKPPINDEIIPQSKVKKSKEKQSKVKKSIEGGEETSPTNPIDEKKSILRKRYFNLVEEIKELYPDPTEFEKTHIFGSQNTPKCFLTYWGEPNKSFTKLRFEMEKTWNTAIRVKTWLTNVDKWDKNQSVPLNKGENPKNWLYPSMNKPIMRTER
jgi:hypothetical protein